MAVGHEQILPSIIIKIGHYIRPTRPRQSGTGHAQGRRDILKSSVSRVTEKREPLIAESADKQILVTVIVEVPEFNSHGTDGVSAFIQSDCGSQRDILI